MAREKAFIYTLILSVLLTLLMTLFLDSILALIDILVRKSGKYLTFTISFLDTSLVGFIPFWTVALYKKSLEVTVKKIIFRSIFFLFSLSLFSFIGFFIIYKNGFAPSMFSPEFLIYQPFVFYWTIFIAVALLFPPLVSKLFLKK